jgi:uncharacterized protein YjbJ (UPF0337 family)
VKGTAKDIAGKVQEEAGRAVGSKEHEAKGLGKQVSGKAQKKYGDAKEAVKDVADELSALQSSVPALTRFSGFLVIAALLTQP